MTPADAPGIPRADLYAPIHKAIRARLATLLVAAGRVDAADDGDLLPLLAELDQVIAMLQRHLDLEERFVHPALEARRPGSARETAQEHAHHAQELDELRELGTRLRHLPALRRAPVAATLYRALGRVLAAQLEHLAHEESENNRVLWETHSDTELRALEQRLHAELTDEDRAAALQHMLPNLTPAERAGKLAAMRDNAPRPAYDHALSVVMPLLDTRAREKLELALGLERKPADFVGLV